MRRLRRGPAQRRGLKRGDLRLIPQAAPAAAWRWRLVIESRNFLA